MSPSLPRAIPRTPQDSPQMQPSPLQHIPLDAALKFHGNDTAPPPSTPAADGTRTPLSPSDCRTLKKILEGVQSPSPLASPRLIKHNDALFGVEYSQDGSSDIGNEGEIQYTQKQYDYGDEADEGYEDEDDSMELSDAVEESLDDSVVHEDQSMLLDDDGTREYVWSDGDTIEDIMNTPGKTAPPAPEQDLGGIYLHDQPTPDEIKVIKLQRAALEEALDQERVIQECQDAAAIGDETIDLHASNVEDEDDAIVLSVDPEFQPVETVQAEIGMSLIEDYVDRAVEIEYFEPFERRTSTCFSPATPIRRASADPLPSSSVTNFLESRPAVMSTPSGRHLDFTPSSTVPGTPFTKTLNYFKQQKGRKNSPSKVRRNASLPEEIAELVRDADDEDLDQYRDMDLAPMEPVMESNTAGDLITFGTPVKARIIISGGGNTPSDRLARQTVFPNTNTNTKKVAKTSPIDDVLGELVPATDVETLSNSPSRLSLLIEQDEDSDADAENSDAVSSPEDKQLMLYPQHPTFVTVIGMLPKALFWVAAAPIAKYSTKAYGVLVDIFAGLELSVAESGNE